MRLKYGKVAPSAEFDPGQGGWRRVRQPGLGSFYLLGAPLAAVTVGSLSVAIAAVGDTSHRIVIRPDDFSVWRVACVVMLTVGGFFAVLAVHEGIHLLAHPGSGRTPSSIVGVWPSRGVLYAYYAGEISRNRFVFMVALPFLLLSVGPVALFWAVGRVYLWLAFVALLNGVGSCFDLLVIALCVCQVPGRAVLRHHGWDTYWRPAVTEAAEPHAAPDRGGMK
jgi:Putative zincin peptidase